MASTMSQQQQQHCSCCKHASAVELPLPPTELTANMVEEEIFADVSEEPQLARTPKLQRTLSPGRAAALGHSDIAPPVHTVIDPARLRSRSRSPWSSMSSSSSRLASSSNTSRSSSVAAIKLRDDDVSEPATLKVPAPASEVYGETAAQRAERKSREKQFWDLRKPHVWNLIGGCGARRS